jgi:glycine hydroxymethyltransferase
MLITRSPYLNNTNMLRRCLRRFAPPATLPGNKSLAEADPEIYNIIKAEAARQIDGLELIASENFTSRAVMECLGSVATNKYAEGYPGQRYYGGTYEVDKIEEICRARALAAFRLDAKDWGVNVQPYSGSPANFAVYNALLKPHDRFMGLDLPCGGHLTHGFYAQATGKRISATSVYWETLPYHTTPGGIVDYDELEKQASIFRPRLIIAGGSAYPRDWDYARYRAVCDKVGALFLVDMSHFSGLVAAQEHRNPFDYADIVTTTTHKTLRGPRSGMIFAKTQYMADINASIFPGLQGGPHMHQIAGVATQLKEVATPEFKSYIQQVKKNAVAMADELVKLGHVLQTGGTENHLLMLDVRPLGLTGGKAEKLFDAVHITVNKNTLSGDKSALNPGGLRLGAPALTTRGLVEKDFRDVAQMLDRGLKIAVKLGGNNPAVKLGEWQKTVAGSAEVKSLCAEVNAYAKKFPFPGIVY